MAAGCVQAHTSACRQQDAVKHSVGKLSMYWGCGGVQHHGHRRRSCQHSAHSWIMQHLASVVAEACPAAIQPAVHAACPALLLALVASGRTQIIATCSTHCPPPAACSMTRSRPEHSGLLGKCRNIRERMQLAYSCTAQCMLRFIFDCMSELNNHIGLAAGRDGTCKYINDKDFMRRTGLSTHPL